MYTSMKKNFTQSASSCLMRSRWHQSEHPCHSKQATVAMTHSDNGSTVLWICGQISQLLNHLQDIHLLTDLDGSYCSQTIIQHMYTHYQQCSILISIYLRRNIQIIWVYGFLLVSEDDCSELPGIPVEFPRTLSYLAERLNGWLST